MKQNVIGKGFGWIANAPDCRTQSLYFMAAVIKKTLMMVICMCILLFSMQVCAQAVSPKPAVVAGSLVAGKISPMSQTISYNSVPAPLTSTASTGGNGTCSYQWQSSVNGNTWTTLPGATALTYAPGALTATTYYRLVSTSMGNSVTTATATVLINKH